MHDVNQAILLLGSNIEPMVNLEKAQLLLSKSVTVISRSRIWETEAVGSDGPNFLNMAVKIETLLNAWQIKDQVIVSIEKELNRIRTEDKYAPRTIDIDIIIFNGKIKDANIWNSAFIAMPVSEIRPDLMHPSTGETLKVIAQKLKSSTFIEPFKEFRP